MDKQINDNPTKKRGAKRLKRICIETHGNVIPKVQSSVIKPSTPCSGLAQIRAAPSTFSSPPRSSCAYMREINPNDRVRDVLRYIHAKSIGMAANLDFLKPTCAVGLSTFLRDG